MRESLSGGRSVRRGAETFPSDSPGKAASLLPLSSFGDGPAALTEATTSRRRAGVELAGQAGGSRLHQGHGRGGLRGDERGAPGGTSVGLLGGRVWGSRGDERGAPGAVGGRAWGSWGTSMELPGLRGDEHGAPEGRAWSSHGDEREAPGLWGHKHGAPGGQVWGFQGTNVGLPGYGGGRKPEVLEGTQKMTLAAPQTGGRSPRTRGGAV